MCVDDFDPCFLGMAALVGVRLSAIVSILSDEALDLLNVTGAR